MKELYLQNSLSGRREVFVPINEREITVYVCGPTVYDYLHIGNARPAVVFDVLATFLRHRYEKVIFVSNITDIDDKINAAAKQNNESITTLTERFTQACIKDFEALGVAPPDVRPKATEHIPEIIDMIENLIEGGFAYESEGHVLFHVPSDPSYGSLSKRSLEDMLAGARVEIASYKKDPKDFILWKPSSSDLPGWDSPWGRGRPGWHIECSAMIQKHLGGHIDIHGGGSDLTFPHHENEAAQSRCANRSKDYVNYWLHNGMITLANEKMSKSLGNILGIRTLLQQHSGEVLRYALLSGHYRSSLSWSDDLIQQAKSSLDSLYQTLRDHNEKALLGSVPISSSLECDHELELALCDDLNTPKALAALHRISDELRNAEDDESALRKRNDLIQAGSLLGLLQDDPEAYFKRSVGSETGDALSESKIESLIEERNQARADRDFNLADQIRQSLLEKGIELEDQRTGTRWRRI